MPEPAPLPSPYPAWGLPAYRSGRGVGLATAYLLVPCLALLLGSIMFSLLSVETALDGTKTVRSPPAWVGLAVFLLSLPLLVLLPLWTVRSYRNVQALRGETIRGSAGWAAAAWFIPVLGGLLAIPSLRRMWAAGPGRHRYLPTLWGLLWSLCQLAAVATVAYGLSLLGSGSSAATVAEQVSSLGAASVDLLPFQVGGQALLLACGLAMVLSVALFTRWEEAESLRRTP